MIWDFGRRRGTTSSTPWLEPENCRAGMLGLRGAIAPSAGLMESAIRRSRAATALGVADAPIGVDIVEPPYGLAYELGMMISISSNGSRLSNRKILQMLTSRRPYRLTLSVYGATVASYNGLTRRRGSFAKFERGLAAAVEAGLPINLNLIVTQHNAHEIDQMRAMAEGLGLPYHVFSNMSPTIYGGAESLPAQSQEYLRKRKPFTGCQAGHTFFHVDPHGMASICKVGRDPQIPLMTEGVEGLARLSGIADGLLLRQGGCSGTCFRSGGRARWLFGSAARQFHRLRAAAARHRVRVPAPTLAGRSD